MRIILLSIPVLAILAGIQISSSVPQLTKGIFDLAAVVAGIIFIWRKFNSFHKNLTEVRNSIMENLTNWRINQTDHIARLEQSQEDEVKKINTIITKVDIQTTKIDRLEKKVNKIETEHRLFHKKHFFEEEGDN